MASNYGMTVDVGDAYKNSSSPPSQYFSIISQAASTLSAISQTDIILSVFPQPAK